MPIVAVNGGGNTPQGVNDGDVDGRDFLVWQRGGSPLETGAFEIKDFSFGVENPTTIGGDTFEFKPELTSEPTAPEPGKGREDWIKVESWQLADTGDDGVRDVLVGADGSDIFNFQPQLTSEPTAPEPYMQLTINDVMITGYQHSGSEVGSFDDMSLSLNFEQMPTYDLG